MLDYLRGHSAAVIADGEHHIFPAGKALVNSAIGLVEDGVLGFDGHLSHPGDGVRALTQRFARSWSICEGSILTGHKPAPGIKTRSMSSPISRRIILSMPATVSFRSSTRGETICLRAKASSCRVRSAERRRLS